ncbi:LytTR family DNA-binding domain-containing protein [Marinilongibacter aquaticus]|uniref:LytR/AlgR family response regulator transcription factor n=1 Tax=Marinilongibacter aquaticus TaxID=2975157 RepID=UPI0021BDE1FB|nr:LytTR family DNA-binding domain-containing protein [Marinilongibacter aquaticus]UBM58658.1 LytTR family DNA-binding domain-containing protein [Marinilongibacter aquaticus]
MIRTVAIDNEKLSLDIVELYCKKTAHIDLLAKFTSPQEAQEFLTEHRVDLLFLDIHMPHQNGIELLKSLSQPPQVIFTTGHPEFAVEAFDLNAVDYLLKPFSYARFVQALEKTNQQLNRIDTSAPSESWYVRVNHETLKIDIENILYIEALDNYLKVHLTGRKVTIIRGTMGMALETLPSDLFTRVHRSYIVNLKWVTRVKKREVYIGDIKVPLSRTFQEEVFKAFG